MNLAKYLTPSEYYRVTIHLDTAYKMGRGWTAGEKNEFENEVYPLLEKNGFQIEPSKLNQGCPTAKIEGTSTSLYFHPMEITGDAREEDAALVMRLLRECKCIRHMKIVRMITLYNLRDDQYLRLLAENSKDILIFLQNMKEEDLWDAGFAFAQECRLPRIGDKSILCSNDVDIKFIDTFVISAKALGLL